MLPKGLEALYPLAGILPPVNRFFLDPSLRSDRRCSAFVAAPASRDNTGVMQFGGGERGGFWLYVPEHYPSDRAWPLVMALHGGSGTGRQFLWSWLRDARSRGAILAAPTSVADTWALMGPDADTPKPYCASWSSSGQGGTWIQSRLLLTGMSDGGTFTYVSGLEPSRRSRTLHRCLPPSTRMLAQMADPERLRGLPIHIIHGALDWMFPVELAQQAQHALASAGAAVTLREVDDLSHTYPRELNGVILSWLAATATPAPSTP